ncbi:MAG: arylamine N-acetyltransferase [Pseudomonas sp.]|uniref:arylamine N-acetyltransferase family protein n=1 Tax=Pseudomonas sp. TaxID=306 RepID=UPI003397B281
MQPLQSQHTQAYLAHLGSPDTRHLDRPTLDLLIQAQLQRVPFENLDVLLGRPIVLDTEALLSKVVEQARGGYCFEVNGLFARLLSALGYRVSLLAARVRWGLPDDAPPTMLSHLMLRVELVDGPYLVDVAFGGPSPYRAIALLDPGAKTPDFPYRLCGPQGAEGLYRMQVHYKGAWVEMYRFDLQPQAWVDQIARSWYSSTHPESIFTQVLTAARSEGDMRLSLRNDSFSRRFADGQTEQLTLASAEAVVQVLAEHFHLDLGADRPRLLARVRQLLDSAAVDA